MTRIIDRFGPDSVAGVEATRRPSEHPDGRPRLDQRGDRGSDMPAERPRAPRLPPRFFVRVAWVVHRAIYRATRGRRGLWEPRADAFGTMRLNTIGRRSGQPRPALLVRQWSDNVVLFAHTVEPSADEHMQLDARGVQTAPGLVKRLVVENDRLAGVELSDGRVIARTAVFVRPVNVPNGAGLLTALGCEIDDGGFAVVDATGRTTADGVWAAGNVVDPRFQVITSAGAGSAAAIAINADLVREEVEQAIAGSTTAVT